MAKKKIIFSLLLLAVFSAGFFSAYLLKPEWQCPICSFDNADRIIPLVNGQFPDVVLEEIMSSEKSIDIVMYEMKPYDSNNSVMQLERALAEKARSGVRVRVILDSSEYKDQMTELTKDNVEVAEYLKQSGAEVKMDDVKKTTHDKLIIIDGRTAIIGSHNWSFSAMERNNEASVLIDSKEIAEYYLNYFEGLWSKY